MDQGMTVTEAAAKYGYSARALRQAIEKGHLKARLVGKTYLLSEAALLIYQRAPYPGRGRPRRRPEPLPESHKERR